MKKGILIPYFESGMEITNWAFYEDDKEGYDGLHILTEEHHIKVFDENNKIVFNEDIIHDTFSNYESYPTNPIQGSQLAGNLWVSWVQANAKLRDWLNMFSKEYRVEVTESKTSKEERKNIKEEIIKNHYENRNFKKEMLLKPKLMFNINNPEYYQEKGETVLMKQLMTINFKYQVFDEKIYIIYVMQGEEMSGKEVDIKFLEEKNFTVLNTNLKKEKTKLLELEKYIKRNFKKNMSIVFKEELTDLEQKLEKEFEEKNDRAKKLKELISHEMFEKLKEAPKYILKGEGVDSTAVKFISFNKKYTRWLLKLKTG